MITLQGISSFCAASLPKVVKVEYLPTAWISAGERIEPDMDGLIGAAPGLDTGSWLSFPAHKLYTQWRDDERESDQGPYYEQELAARVFRLRPSVQQEFRLMTQYDFLLRMEDQNGQQWIMGEVAFPFRFTWSAQAGELNTYNIRFFSQNRRPALGFTPDF